MDPFFPRKTRKNRGSKGRRIGFRDIFIDKSPVFGVNFAIFLGFWVDFWDFEAILGIKMVVLGINSVFFGVFTYKRCFYI
jgi:hypothetical protein